MPIVTRGEVRIEYIVSGKGPPIVLLPFRGGDVTQFEKLSAILVESGYKTVAVNPRTCGHSVGPLNKLSLHDFAQDAASVIEDSRSAPAHVLGRGFGNRVARCLAADRPDLVKSVILFAAGGKFRGSAFDQQPVRAPKSPDVEQKERFRVASGAAKESINRSRPVPTFAARLAWAQTFAARTTPLKEWWTAGNVPILVVQGLQDKIAPPANGRELLKELGNRVRLVEIPEAQHVFDEGPDVVQALLSFLRDNR